MAATGSDTCIPRRGRKGYRKGKTIMAKKTKNIETKAPQADMTTELADQRAYISTLKKERDRDLAAQREFTKKMAEAGGVLGLVDERNFVESMRDVGYKNSGYAIAELVDNAIQAGAERIDILLHCPSGEHVGAIAVMDDGHGMDKEMIAESVRWGGTHRHGKRDGFGRFGQGKPSACVSQGRQFTSFSVTEGGAIHSVKVDLDEIAKGVLGGRGQPVNVPPAKDVNARPLPKWVRDYRKTQGVPEELGRGTVVLIDKVDRASFKARTSLRRHLVESMGVIYRYYLTDVAIYIDGDRVKPVDPLFTLPGHYDRAAEEGDAERAEDHGIIRFEVFHPETKQSQGWVRVRFSRVDPTFPRIDKSRGVGSEDDDDEGVQKKKRNNGNYRWTIMRNWNKGLLIMRKGRQIDTIEARCPFRTFLNNDRYWGCEIDFDPRLDEEFRVTTSKQQVVLTDRMWALLVEHGVSTMIRKLALTDKKLRDEARTKTDSTKDGKRASENAAEAAQKYASTRPGRTTTAKQAEAEQNTKREADRRAKASSRPKEKVEEEVKQEVKQLAFKITHGDFPPGSPFFACELLAADGACQVHVIINKNHRFYGDIYAAPQATPALRAALEVMLFAVADHMTRATGDKEMFYKREVSEWSNTLDEFLHELAKASPDDAGAAGDEVEHEEATVVDAEAIADK